MKRTLWILSAAVSAVLSAALSVTLLSPAAWAAEAPQQQQQQQPVSPDRLYNLTNQLRCPVCQNESLTDSSAPLAIDLKNEIQTRMAAGQSDAQIKKFLVDRYGDFVTYRPPFDSRTLLLWLGPLLFVMGGLFGLWRAMRPGHAHTHTGADAGAADAARNEPQEPAR
ncbi:MAG: cytochrome c-type biogenesis protein CcmH [Burkholderiaceae bacterium]|jgi:cytochrome c-type biogenesis protein CcmH|nr:cytochrome c-type biogenesis protein CcmH [Burkholderiaceae bacterium]